MSKILELAMDLLARPSVTPHDGGCQELLARRLETLGFETVHLRFGDVDNLWARRGHAAPLVVFAGHTDVVPPGPLEQWRSAPFAPEVRDGFLYGRGAADMKSSLAAFIIALEEFLAQYPDARGSLGVLITSDEEAAAVNGTAKVVEWLKARGQKIDYCVVGEPSSHIALGDVIKNGRRGSLNGRLTVLGVQGHVAYPDLADNPIHRATPALAALIAEEWDQGNAHFPATSFQIANVQAGTGADNVIPSRLDIGFNFRYSTAVTDTILEERVQKILQAHGLSYRLEWSLSGKPFLTPPGTLVAAVRAAARDVLDQEPALSTSGGTSDGRFIAPAGAEVVELGPVNATIHKVNECISVADLAALAKVYSKILEHLLG